MNTEKPQGASVEFRKVSKLYPDGTYGLREVSIAVPPGQFCVFLGRSGAGKSTLLRLINGLIEPTHGEVLVDKVRLTPRTLRKVQPRIAMIHQHFNLVPRMTVFQNVLAGALHRISTVRALFYSFPKDLQRRACHWLGKVNLTEDHLYRRASQLSGGQQQRVGIARAFILDPEVVLADEPVASLDPRISRDILQLLRDAARESGATVLCSLHQVDLALEFADRVIAMRDGEVVFDGSPEALDEGTISGIYDNREEPVSRRTALRSPKPAHSI